MDWVHEMCRTTPPKQNQLGCPTALTRQVTDEAVQVAPVQIPEEELRDSPSVTVAVSRFELPKDSWQFRVSSFELVGRNVGVR